MNRLASNHVGSNRIVIVLGMHRGGTSAITRSLEALGVDLGGNLLPPGSGNPTGFWEDRDCLAINEELLAHFGSSYDRLSVGLRFAESDPWFNALKTRATELIKIKASSARGLWGFKDPRTARLMSFWRPVIAASGHTASYLIAARNPISVARSLEVRDGIPPGKAYLLWLQHMVAAFVDAEGSKRVVVDYDLLLDRPSDQIQRIASALKLPRFKQRKESIDDFSRNFLTNGLRHTKFSLADCSDTGIPGDVKLAYDLFSRLSKDEVADDHPAVIEQFREFSSRLTAYSPVFTYANSLENDKANLSRVIAERDNQLSRLNDKLAERDTQLVAYQHQAERYDALLKNSYIDLNSAQERIINMDQTIASHDGFVKHLTHSVSMRNERLANLASVISERDAQLAAYRSQAEKFAALLENADSNLNSSQAKVASLNEIVAQYDDQVASLRLSLVQRDEQIDNINSSIAERDRHLTTYQHQAEQFKSLLENAHSNLNTAQIQIASFSQIVAQYDSQVASLRLSLTQRDEQLDSINSSIAERDRQLTIYQHRVEQISALLKDAHENMNGTPARINNLSQAIAERDGRIAVHQRQSAHFVEMLKSARTELITARAEIASLNQRVRDLSESQNSLYRSVVERDERLRSLNSDIANANSIIAGIVSSRSWRVLGLFRDLKLSLSTHLRRPRQSGSASGLRTFFSRNPGDASFTDHPVPAMDLLTPTKSEASGERLQFDADFYRRLYSDIREHVKGDPYEHFVAHGKREGRLGFLPPINYSGDFSQLNPHLENVLVVSHEASTTGAPVLSLNIIWELKAKYNVIVVLMNGGTLWGDLQAAANIVIGPLGHHGDVITGYQIDDILSKCTIKFAIVNSAEARMVLPELARHFVPSIALIHEFASYTRPHNAIEQIAFWASETIFSADIVRDNAVAAFPGLSSRLPAVIPQGLCSRVLTSSDESTSMSAADKIIRTFRPAGWADDTPVMLGVGSVHLRKGVDLFVACAAKVSQSVRCRFIWIGNGYDPEHDTDYSAYLRDQVQRAGLSDSFAFMGETSRIDCAYENADVLVVSSRLDPLPNVSVDAVSRGLPIVCFDKATGIANILRRNGLASECVAPYLDVEGLALRVIAFMENPDLRRSVSTELKEIAERTFNMTTYVEQIENIAVEKSLRSAQESIDCATIAENPLLDLNYLAGPLAEAIGKDGAIRKFVRSWENGFFLRKPFAGFHPGIYAEHCGIRNLESNPLGHYMRSGSPEGPWRYDVIDASTETTEGTNLQGLSAALHLHVFYPDLAPIIIERLNANIVRPDLFISVPSESARKEMECLFLSYAGRTVDIQVVPNRGRDIGAFLTAFGEYVSRYEFIGHFHTKKTAELADSVMGQVWFSFLLENLIGGRFQMADKILGRMAADPSVGLVFPDDPHVVGWDNNRETALCLTARMGMQDSQEMNFNFPVGTMFWARTAAIRRLLDLRLDWNDYPSEPLTPDGTMLHAIERLLPFVAEASGFRSVSTNVPGVTR